MFFLLGEEKAAREARTSKANQAWCRDRGKVLRLDLHVRDRSDPPAQDRLPGDECEDPGSEEQ